MSWSIFYLWLYIFTIQPKSENSNYILPFPQLDKHTIISATNSSACVESCVLPPLNEQRCMSMALMIQDSVYIGDQYLFSFFGQKHLQWGCQNIPLLALLPSEPQSSSRTGKGVFSIPIAQTGFTISFFQFLHW